MTRLLDLIEARDDAGAEAHVVAWFARPGGAVVAKELAEAGRDVILVEEGPPFGAADFRQEAGESMQRTLREGGTRATRGNAYLPTMQVAALGGGSLINSAICARAPAFVFDAWAERTGVRLTRAVLDPHYERVERFLFVEPTPMEVMGERNLRFKRGCDALGIFAGSPAVNPMLTCMALADRVAEGIAARW